VLAGEATRTSSLACPYFHTVLDASGVRPPPIPCELPIGVRASALVVLPAHRGWTGVRERPWRRALRLSHNSCRAGLHHPRGTLSQKSK